MNKNKIEKMKNALKSPISEYKTVICNLDINSHDFLKNAEESNYKIEQFIFRTALKKIRKLKNITQKNLAELIRKKPITIQAYENSRLKISPEFIYLVIKKINLTKIEFIDDILFSDELFVILYNFIKVSTYENKSENETEILNFIEKIFSNIIIELFENEEWDKKHNAKKLSREAMFLKYLTEYFKEYLKENGYILKIYTSADGEEGNIEIISEKADCYIEISHEDFSKICEELNNYFLFLISKYKTQK